ncbi:hypothetical protein FRC06_001422 [Ceratobasidium sp. 370]|nr:hypothetical protein FRC06_001422 [Ceratobasidium sp. 370]
MLPNGKQAWLVYVTVGNIDKEIRRQPSKRATTLLGYLPVPSTLPKGVAEGKTMWELFHKCMSVMVEPLIEASQDRVEMRCSDAGETTEGWANLGKAAPLQTKVSTLRVLEEAEVGIKVGVNSLGLRTVWLFWVNLPHVNLAAAITPDLLHQLHRGMFLDHLVPWCRDLMGVEEMDRRFKAMSRYQGMRHFANGISGVSEWTRREAKEMARVFLSVIDGAVPVKAVRTARALIDFMFLAHSPSLTSLELRMLDGWLATFHANKEVFRKRKNGTVRNFSLIQKLHMIRHYPWSTTELGTPDGFNTEATERLHIPLSKEPYRVSNKVNPTEQMANMLEYRDAVARRRDYLQFQRARTREGNEHGESGNEDRVDADGEGLRLRADRQTPRIPIRPFEPRPQIAISNRSTWPLKAGSSIMDCHEAFDLIPATNEFLNKLPDHPPSTRSRVLEHQLFPCWSQVTLRYDRLPFKPTEPVKSCIVRASPASFKNGKQTWAASFDTVLVPCDPHAVGVTRYCPARVRIIFWLPLHVQHFYPHTLVYLELFTPFTRTSNSPTGFYRTSPATRGGKRQVAVMPLSAVRMPCQLVPNFRTLRPGLSLSNNIDILGSCQEFGLNSYADYFQFAVTQHWESCAAA